MESNKPIVLIFSDWYLPGYKAGGPITSTANMVQLLSDSFIFKIICSDRDYLDEQPYGDVVSGQWNQGSEAEVFYTPPFMRTIVQYMKLIKAVRPHVVYINGIFSFDFSIKPLMAARKYGFPIIIAPRGMLALGALSIKPFRKRVYLHIARRAGLFKGVKFHATSDDESNDILRNISRKARIAQVANIPSVQGLTKRPYKKEGQISIIQVARIAREKNTLFAIECLRGLRGFGTVHMSIIGSVYDRDYFEACRIEASGLPDGISVSFLGSLAPKDISKELERHHLFFLPTLGENYGHAIIEALLSGCPVLISDKTPWTGLEALELGADFDLHRADLFIAYIRKIMEMNEAAYSNSFTDLALRASSMIDLPKLRADYTNLLT